MKTKAPVMMIALDAAEVTVIERLCAEGKMPALQSLIQRGCFGLLRSNVMILEGGIWPTFYTSKDIPWHGIYQSKAWRHENMRFEVVDEAWLPEKPFWENLDKDKYRVAILDVPLTTGAPKEINGVQLAGWGTHELTVQGSWPPEMWKDLKGKFGSPIFPLEFFGPQSPKSLLRLRSQLIEATEQMAAISESVLDQGPWDLFLVMFASLHRGAHYLWDLSQIDKAGLSPETLDVLENAMVDLYQTCDRALARLIQKAPADAKIMVFSLHGSGLNVGWADLCGEILSKIQRKNMDGPVKTGLLYKLRRALPWQLMRQVTTRLPLGVANWLVTVWSKNMFDWSTTRYFPVPMGLAGYVRINLKGREPQGIVEPGEEYDQLCDELARAFLSFRDIDTDKPIVERVYRMDELAPPDAPYRDRLPDLMITWSDISAIQLRGIRSEDYGEIHFNTAGKLPSGCSGGHQGKGWFAAVGKGIEPGTRADGQHILDLVPTVYEWLGAEPPEDFQGRPIPALSAQEAVGLRPTPPQA